MAENDFQEVIKLCTKFTEGNERVRASAHFTLGSLLLDQGRRADAKTQFDEALTIHSRYLLESLEKKGQTIPDDQKKDLDKLVEPSIFDDETTKALKATLVDIREFINECKDLEQIQPQLDQMKKEAEQKKAEQGGDCEVDPSFGKAPADAATFKPIQLKKSRKRTLEEAAKTDVQEPSKPEAKEVNGSKVAMENGTTEQEANISDDNKENKKRKLNN